MTSHTTIHATCVAMDDRAVLLRGQPGAGKSDLALCLIESGGILVSDDQVIVTRKRERLIASPPDKLKGLLEVRGVGICCYPFMARCELFAVVDLEQGCLPERLPDLEAQKQEILGVGIAGFLLDPFQASAPARVRAMLKLSDL